MIASFSLYTALLSVHVVLAVVCVGGGVSMGLLALQALRTDDPVAIAGAARTGGWLGRTFFTPASFLLLLSGVGMMLEGGLEWDRGWILFALAGWLMAFLLGVAFFRPQGAQIGRLAAERGITDPEVQAGIRRVFLVSRVDTVLLLVIVVDMVLKPLGTGLLWLVVAGVALAVPAAGADRLWPRSADLRVERELTVTDANWESHFLYLSRSSMNSAKTARYTSTSFAAVCAGMAGPPHQPKSQTPGLAMSTRSARLTGSSQRDDARFSRCRFFRSACLRPTGRCYAGSWASASAW